MTSVDYEHRFKALVECSPDAIFITDFDSARFIDVNLKACELFGYAREELCGKTGRQLHPTDDALVVDEISRDLIANGRVHRSAVRLQKKSGEIFFGELRSGVYRIEGSATYSNFRQFTVNTQETIAPAGDPKSAR